MGVALGEDPRRTDRSDEALFASIYPSLRRFAAVVGGMDIDPDDLVQEAVARALGQGPLWSLRSPNAYLRTAILHIEMNRRRGVERRDRAIRRLASDSGHSASYPSDLDALRLLSSEERAVVYLAVVEGLSHRDIAELLGMREAAVRKRASRGLRRLRDAFEKEEL